MKEPDTLLQREKLLRDTFTAAELQVYILIVLASVVAAWIGDPRSYWLFGLFSVAGGLFPYILRTHEVSHPFFIHSLWTRSALLCAPVWALLIQFITGLLQDPIVRIEIGPKTFLALEQTSSWWPSTSMAIKTWPTACGFAAIYLVTITLFIVPKSRVFFERLMAWLCGSAVSIALFGYIQAGFNLEAPIFTNGTGKPDFFAFFPYDGHWAAFATLWMCACMGMGILSIRLKDDNIPFIESRAPLYITGGIILGASAFLVDATYPSIGLIFTTSLMLLLIAAQFTNNRTDPHRETITLLSGIAATLGITWGITQLVGNGSSQVFNHSLIDASIHLFLEKPAFGWGIDSFSHILPYYSNDFIQSEYHERVGSDFFQYLAELGILGIIFPPAFATALILRYLAGRHDMQLTNHLLIGCSTIALLSIVDTPLMSPSVVFSFLTIFFIALRWADLSRNKADEVDKENVFSG